MGLLIDGQWHDQWYDTKTTGGAFKRQDSLFRHWVRADGSTVFCLKAGDTTFMSRLPVPGRTAPSLCANSKG